ncbi:hypothetical protein BUALT_Bualt06G0039800 [Buddleja alternifolia]|uniref:DDE Tnp4 domain-containing protein n=1 Tax=Buddleja alternifolia TaxID=168488 RepID=A0AAV6XE34_9LAMI|nr:hypothetical protein BUALT_Bualt06G0039800 [Buddleja alternifolia]
MLVDEQVAMTVHILAHRQKLQGELLKTPEVVPDNSTDERWKWFKEGSTADGRVLRDAISRRNGLVVPRGSYYLVNNGYTNGEGFLTPFRGQRYHLNDWSVGHQPIAAEEFFNMKHSFARNVIERIMDILTQDTRGRGKYKRKWKYEEDAKLVDAFLDMVNLGTYKAENGFKPGYLNYVEEKMHISLPNSGLKAKPHIESRIKTLKKDFNIESRKKYTPF